MKKYLIALEPASLKKIASDISIEYSTQEETAAKVAQYYRDYGLSWPDLAARYQIKNGKINSY